MRHQRIAIDFLKQMEDSDVTLIDEMVISCGITSICPCGHSLAWFHDDNSLDSEELTVEWACSHALDEFYGADLAVGCRECLVEKAMLVSIGGYPLRWGAEWSWLFLVPGLLRVDGQLALADKFFVLFSFFLMTMSTIITMSIMIQFFPKFVILILICVNKNHGPFNPWTMFPHSWTKSRYKPEFVNFDHKYVK